MYIPQTQTDRAGLPAGNPILGHKILGHFFRILGHFVKILGHFNSKNVLQVVLHQSDVFIFGALNSFLLHTSQWCPLKRIDSCQCMSTDCGNNESMCTAA